jgi:5'-nucleotidase
MLVRALLIACAAFAPPIGGLAPSPEALAAASVAAAETSVAGTATPAGPVRPSPVTIKIIGFNDYHGHLQSPGTFGEHTAVPVERRPAVGGADALAAAVARLQARNRHHAVVGAGDFIGASPLISALFHDEPAVETLNRIGVEFNAVGNHEFDKGAAELLRLQHGGCKRTGGRPDPHSCRGAQVGTPVPFEGARFRWLSANVVSTVTGRPLLPAYGIKSFGRIKIAFVGLTLEGTPGIVAPSGVAGLAFRDEAETVNALVPKLRREGVDGIVVLLHQGGVQTGGLSDINGCDGDLAGSELASIVARLDDAVDLVISGHTHAAYNCSAHTVDVRSADGVVTRTARPTGLPNASGRRIPVTSAGAYGRVLTDIDLTLDPRSDRIVAVHAVNRLVDRTDPELDAAIAGDPRVRNLVAAYDRLVTPIAHRVIGSISADLPSRADAAGNMPAGELIADAQLAATAIRGRGDAVIAFINPGGVRHPGFTHRSSAAAEGDGQVTYGEAFTAQPFGNALVTLTLTGQDLKRVLEQQFAGCRGQTHQRILVPSRGFTYSWSAGEACDARVRDVRLRDAAGAVDRIVDADGVVRNPGKTYRVTVNDFLAGGGDGFTAFRAGRDRLVGPRDIDALTAFLGRHLGPARAAYDPAAPSLMKPRVTRLP